MADEQTPDPLEEGEHGIPTFTRLIMNGTINVVRDGPYVVAVLGEVHEGDTEPAALEQIPIHWQYAKMIGFRLYMEGCAAELEEKAKEQQDD